MNYKNNYYYHDYGVVDAESGTIDRDNYEIIYYYELKQSKIKVHHYIKGTETKDMKMIHMQIRKIQKHII